MANKELITDFIDEKAFAQFDKLRSELKESQKEFLELVKTVNSFNTEINKSKSIEEVSVSINKAAKATEKLAEAEEKQIKVSVKVAEATEKVIEATKKNIEVSVMDGKTLSQVSGTLDEQIKSQIRYKTEIANIAKERKMLMKLDTTSLKRNGEMERSLVKLAERENMLKEALRQSNLEIKRHAREQVAAEGSSDMLAARLDRLRAAYRGLSDEEREAAETGGVLLAQINSLDTKLKELDSSQGVHNRFVGEYERGTKELNASLTNLFPQLEAVRGSFEKTSGTISGIYNVLKDYVNGTLSAADTAKTFTNAITGTTSAIESSAKANASATVVTEASTAAVTRSSLALRAFRIALISTGIGAIIVALGSLITYLTTTQSGIDKVTAVTRPLTAVFQSLIGVVQNVGEYLISAFTNPKKVITDIYNFVKNNIITTFTAFYDILYSIVTLDLDGIKNGFKDLTANAVDATKEVGKFFGEAWEKGKEVDKIQKQIIDSEIELIKTQGNLNRLIQEQGEIARDTGKSNAERQRAAKAAIEAINKLSEQEIKLQDLKIKKLEIEHSYNDTAKSDSKELAQLEAERENIFASAAKQRVRLTGQINSINKSNISEAANRLKEDDKLEKERLKNQESAQKRIIELAIRKIDFEESTSKRLSDLYAKNAADENKSFADRMDNLSTLIVSREESIKLSYDRELLLQKDHLAEVLKLEKEGRKEEAEALKEIIEINIKEAANVEKKAREDLAKEISKIQSQIFKDQMNDEQVFRKNMLESSFNAELVELEKQYTNRSIKEKEYNISKYNLQARYNNSLLENEISTIEKIIEANKAKGIIIKSDEQKIAELKIKYSKQAADSQIKDLERVREREKQINDARKELGKEIYEFGLSLFQSQFDRENQALEKRMLDLDRETEGKRLSIEQEVMDEDLKRVRIAEIENESFQKRKSIEDEQRKIQVKQAKFDRAVSIAGIIANTARGVTSALSLFPPNIPLAAIIGGTGAAQLAKVASTPLPKFWTGTDNAPEGFAHIGEKGAELMISPSGEIGLTPATDTIAYLQKGTKIIDAEKTKNIFNAISSPESSSTNVNIDISRIVDATNKSTEEIKKAIKSRPEHRTVLTKSGLRNIYINGSKWNSFKNNLLN